MRMRSLTPIATILMVHQLAIADASYKHTEQMTGGQLVDMLKNMPLASKQMQTLTAPISSTTMVRGNQKAVVSTNSTEITDLDKEVIIHIDNTAKTYSIVTFADMRKMMAQMPQRINDAQAKVQQAQPQMPQTNLQTTFSTSVTDPGVSKLVNGKNAKEQVLTLKMTATDPDKPGFSVVYSVTTEIWTTPDVPAEMKEVQDFDARFAKKLMAGVDVQAMMADMQKSRAGSSAAMAQMFGSKPGAADAFAQMEKEMAKITGTRILEVTRMGGTGTGISSAPATSAAPANGAAAPPAQNGNSAAGQVATDTATQTAAGESSKLGIPGSAFGGALMNALNKKKAKPATPAAAPAPATAATPADQATTDISLMEMTTQTNDFSQEAIPSSVFQIPAGYKQVPSPMEQMLTK